MRVYDIISVNEALDIRPSTILGADGKPSGFEVFDTDNPKQPLQKFTGPGSDGKAEQFRDAENAKRRGVSSGPKSNNVPLKDKTPTPKNKTIAQKAVGVAVKTGFRNLLRVGRVIGFSQLPRHVEDYQIMQINLYAQYLKAKEDGMDPLAAKQQFEALSKAAFGQWVLSSAIIPLGAELIVRSAKAGIKGTSNLVKSIRAANTGTTVAAAATGVGLLPGVIKFILVEGAIWAVSYALASEAVAKTVFKYFVGSSYDASIQLLYQSANLGQAAGSGIANLVGDAETKAAWRDVKNAMKMDPMDTASGQAIGNQQDVDAAPRSGSSSLSANVPD